MYYIKLLLDEADYDLKNYGDWGGCYQPRSINTRRDLHNSSDHTKAESVVVSEEN